MLTGYKFRGLPCNCVPDADFWAVSGRYVSHQGTSAGILEWCTSKEDAQRMLAHMGRYGGFRKLRAHKWA